jgi:hypothetical protein
MRKAYELSMRVFELSKSFPPEERFALTTTHLIKCLSKIKQQPKWSIPRKLSA